MSSYFYNYHVFFKKMTEDIKIDCKLTARNPGNDIVSSKQIRRISQITGTHWYSCQDTFKIFSFIVVHTQREFTMFYVTSFKLRHLLFKPAQASYSTCN